jgi:hypothetical protein
MLRRPTTPVQRSPARNPSSNGPPAAPEWSTTRARTSPEGPYSLTSPLPPRRRRRCRLDDVAGNLTLDTLGPNLHHRTESHRSHTPPRARKLPEAEGSGGLTDGSTNRLPIASVNCSEERSREEVTGVLQTRNMRLVRLAGG